MVGELNFSRSVKHKFSNKVNNLFPKINENGN